MPINFKAIAERLLADAAHHLPQWLPGGKFAGREFVVGSLQGEAGHSLSINIDKGIWKDFQSGKGGADLISLYAAIHNIRQGEAAKQFATDKDNKVEDEYFAGPEHKGPIPPHSKWGDYSAVFEYRRADGKVAGYICRFEPPNERKQLIPRTSYIRADGSIYWRWKKWPGLSPLYRLPELIDRRDAPVLIVEGEGKAHRAQRLLPNYIVIGWCGGAEAVKGTDWSPLKGRAAPVWIWPDNDAVGLKAAAQIREILPAIHIVDVASIRINDNALPEGFDLGDAWDEFDPKQYMQEAQALHVSQQALPMMQESTLGDRLLAINSQYAIIKHGSKVLIMNHYTGQDGNGKLEFISIRDFLAWQENNIIYQQEDDKVKQIKVGKRWLEWEERQEFEDTYFEPNGKYYSRRYNLWRGFAVEPSQQGDCSLFLSHIHDNICQKNAEQYKWVMAWLADLFQKPNRKLGTALVLRGPMGVGKGAFSFHIGKMLGKHFMSISQSSQLVGKFNSHMADKVLMFVDEGWWGDDRGYATGILRNLITEHRVTIEMKGKDAIEYANFTRFIIAANADWVVPVGDKNERRFSIIDVGDDHQRDKPYFKAISDQMNSGGYENFLHFMLNYEYDEHLPGTILNTPALLDNKIHSMPDELKWFYDCLMEESIGDEQLRDNLDNDIPCKKFYEVYQEWCKNMMLRKILTANSLPKALKKADIFLSRSKKTVDSAGKREWFYLLPDLKTMREYFERHIGGAIDWEKI